MSAIGIDLGGTRVKAGRLGPDGAVTDRRVEPVTGRDEAQIVAHLAAVVEGLDPSGCLPVGVAAAGVIDAAAGVIRESPNFPTWRDFALGRDLAAATGRRVALDNDANAVIYGEYAAGAGRGAANLIGYTLGTGVGGAIVLNGALWRGERGMAGELGHVAVVPGGRPCGCGSRGCLEQYVGAVGIRASCAASDDDTLRALATSADAPARVAALVEAGVPAAAALYRDLGETLGRALGAIIHIFDVTHVVLAGGVAAAWPHFAPALRRSLEAHTFASMREGVAVVPGTLGADAGVIGAAVLGARHR